MKLVLLILRYFLTWITPVPVTYYLGIWMLPLVFMTGIFWPRVGFGLALWNFVFLLAIPSFSLPIAVRTLLSNRRLMMMPGFAGKTILAAFIQIALTAIFLPFFAWLYDIARFPSNSVYYSFFLLSFYLLATFMLARTQWGVQAIGIIVAPVFILGSRWLRISAQLPVPNTEQLYALTIFAMLGWLFAWRLAAKARHVHPASPYRYGQHQQFLGLGSRLGQGFWPGTASAGSPALSLLLGYPANNFSVFRLKLLAGFLGPLPLVFFMWLFDSGPENFSWPELLQILMFIYLFSATFMGFQNAELVARLRLLWLKAPHLREDLWRLLETQHWLSQATFLLLTILLTVGATFLLSIKPLLLLQYPLLLLALNANTSYYCICTKVKGWSALAGSILIGITWFFSTWLVVTSVNSGTTAILFVLEFILLGSALTWRQLAKAQFARVDWQALKPMHVRRGATT